ncbi:HPr kinase/phosphorylase [Ruminiclostridium herbifermentans]|uniref:HPr kinase/phosphorylase n=1 Tax=Ruminiclostridium herbifermentans TaxID=2488810 RepID=A0A4U7JD42_9FIRM|nr:HPr(Ser) kinase/phosphatase [Ruminiclostridium herbifermentans]QNU67846.1 HPr kinase/phosphorylase [Ruminiclostridium herbifermentans]
MFSVTLKEIMDEFQLEELTGRKDFEEIEITSADVNRPGLQLAGYMEYFGTDRMQIIGKGETAYLMQLRESDRYRRLDNFFKCGFPCMVVARGLGVFPEMIEVGRKYNIPVLRTDDITSRFMSGVIRYLNVQLAPRTSMHGVLVEVYGEGILILGESGVGKSEIALELVKRGHRLVADDNVEIRKVSDRTLVGTAPDIIRHFIEIRGIGILDVKNLYGVGSVKMTENINLVIKLEPWNDKKIYDRLGLEDEFTEVLGLTVPCLTIPVSPGRNLAIIVEVAAMNNRQKKMGYNAAQALSERVLGNINKNNIYNNESGYMG